MAAYIFNLHLDDSYYSEHMEELEESLHTLQRRLDVAGISLSADSSTIFTIVIDRAQFNKFTKGLSGRPTASKGATPDLEEEEWRLDGLDVAPIKTTLRIDRDYYHTHDNELSDFLQTFGAKLEGVGVTAFADTDFTIEINEQKLAAVKKAKKKKAEEKRKDKPVIPLVKEAHHTVMSFRIDNAFYAERPDDLTANMETLQKKLESLGFQISVIDGTLSIDCNDDAFLLATRRGAGRKKSKANKELEEIYAYRDTHTMQETAEWLGLTRQTLYRKLKEAEKNSDHTL